MKTFFIFSSNPSSLQIRLRSLQAKYITDLKTSTY